MEDEKAYQEFRSEITKNRKVGKIAKVRNSWGIYDAYKKIRKNHWYDIGRPLKEHEFYSIIRGVNNLLAEEIAKGNTVAFPSRMGRLELRKFNVGAKIVDGKLRVTYPVNWEKTLRLWFEDSEARQKKTVVRNENSTVYRVKYSKWNANYNNQSFYEFTLNRKIKKALSENIRKGTVDTLYYGK